MLKQGSFINKKYCSLLIFNLFTWAAYGFNLITDALIGGNQLGEVAISAISIVAPMTSVIEFTAMLFTKGYAVMVGRHIGEFDKDSAYKVAGQSIITTIGKSLIMIAILLLIKESYLSFFRCEGEIYNYASIYYNWMIVCMATTPMSMLIHNLVVMDGDAPLIMAGLISVVVSNVVLSIVLCQTMGIAGLGLATCIGDALKIIICSLHFIRKSNSIHFKLSWSWTRLLESFKIGYAHATMPMFVAVINIIINRVIIDACGTKMVPVSSSINLLVNMFMIATAAFDSCAGYCAVFVGEKNNYAINNIMKTCKKAVLGIGLGMNLLFFFLAGYIPALYGMESPEVIEASVTAIRVMSFSAIPCSVAIFVFNVYMLLGKPFFCFLITLLFYMICPLMMVIPMAYIFGINGVAAGMLLRAFLAVAVFAIIIRGKYGQNGFPLYLPDYGEEVIGFDLKVTKEIITQIRDKVAYEFAKRGYDTKKLELLIEELYTRILEKNSGKAVTSECVLLFGPDYARIIIRDSGVIFNYIDVDNRIESLNAHVLNGLLMQTREKNYITTAGFNKNGFIYRSGNVKSR